MADQKKYFVQSKLPANASLYSNYSNCFEITAQDDEEALDKAKRYFSQRQRLGQGEIGFRLLHLVYEEYEEEG